MKYFDENIKVLNHYLTGSGIEPLNDYDMKILTESFDDDILDRMDLKNVFRIFKYLDDNGVFYAKDIFASDYPLFFLDSQEFIKRFEKLKDDLGPDYVDKLGEDASLIDPMYVD